MGNFNEKCAKKIISYLSQDKDLSESEEEILVYGYTLLLENLYKTVILLVIAFLTHTARETCIIVGSFALLRSCAGGIHCRSSLGCTSVMLGIWGIGLAVSRLTIPIPILAIMLSIIVWVIVRYAPCFTQNNPILDIHVWRRKRVGGILVMIALTAGGLVCYGLGDASVLNMVVTSMFLEAISILLLKEREDGNYEEAGC